MSLNEYSQKQYFQLKFLLTPRFLNILFLSSCFFMLFFSFNTTQNFETTVNDDLGFWSLAVLYFVFSFSNFFSSVVVKSLKEKLSLFLGSFTYVLFIAANIRPNYWIIIPASAINGIGAAVLWNAQGSFITKYSDEHTIGFHSGAFFAIFMLNMVFGNLFAALFLKYFSDETTGEFNETSVFYLFVVFSIIGLVGSIGFLFIRNPTTRVFDKKDAEKKVSFLETTRLFKDRIIQLLIPICVYSGLSQSLNFGSFTLLIGDTIMIGYTMALFGAADCIGSILNGSLSGKFGKRVVLLCASLSALVGYALSVYASQIPKSNETSLYFFIAAIFLGYGDSGFNTQLYSMIGSFYPKQSEAAFAAFKLLQALSTSISFMYSPYIGYPFLVLICTFFLMLGLVFLVILDQFVVNVDANLNQRTYMTDSDYGVTDTDVD